MVLFRGITLVDVLERPRTRRPEGAGADAWAQCGAWDRRTLVTRLVGSDGPSV